MSSKPSVVHFAGGPFFLAHVAPVLQLADLEVCVINRSERFRNDLHGDEAYVIARSPRETTVKPVRNIAECLVSSHDPKSTVDRIADPATELITLTVTQDGYEFDDSDVTAISDGLPPTSRIGFIVAGLHRREQMGIHAPIVMSLDNITGNGEKLRTQCVALADKLGDSGFSEWIRTVRFPSTMVDRIVPKGEDWMAAMVAETYPEIADKAFVVTEPRPSLSWLISNHGNDPLLRRLESKGKVELVDDVSLYSVMKRQLVNGSHFVTGTTGLVNGHKLLSEALEDPDVRRAVEVYGECVKRNIVAPDNVDLDAYHLEVLERFSNPLVPDKLERISRKGSAKIVDLVVSPLRRLSARQQPTKPLVQTVATWAAFLKAGLAHQQDPSTGFKIEDPKASREILVDGFDPRIFGDAQRFRDIVLRKVVSADDFEHLSQMPDFLGDLQKSMDDLSFGAALDASFAPERMHRPEQTTTSRAPVGPSFGLA